MSTTAVDPAIEVTANNNNENRDSESKSVNESINQSVSSVTNITTNNNDNTESVRPASTSTTTPAPATEAAAAAADPSHTVPVTAGTAELLEYDSHDIRNLTAEQLAKLEQFKTAVLAQLPTHSATDYTYMRFLRARKFDVTAATAMYLKYIKWRTDCSVDSILTNPALPPLRDLLQRIVPESFHKFDKYGMPAYFIKAGQVNPKLLLRNITIEELTQAHIWGMEYSFQRASDSSIKLGKNIDQFVNICDLSGLSMSHRQALKYIKSIAAIDNDYYPEALGKTYLINCPYVFPMLWNILKGWIDPVTREKIHVLGSNYKELLLQRFNAEDLPAEFGGNCNCLGTGNGCIKMYTEPEVNQYVEGLESKLNLTEHTLPAGKSIDIVLAAGEYGGTFEYYFKSKSSDIGFTVTFQRSGGAENHPIKYWHPHSKYSGKQAVKGSFVTDYSGTVTFSWDNRHSYWHTESIREMIKYTTGVEGVKLEEEEEEKSNITGRSPSNSTAATATPTATNTAATATATATATVAQ